MNVERSGILRLVLLASILAVPLLLGLDRAAAWEEPDSFRGVAWGSSSEQAKKTALDRGEPFAECTQTQTHEVCSVKTAIGSVPARAIYRFRDNKFVSAALAFGPSDFPTLFAIFVERYGQPTVRREETIQTAAGGAKMSNQIAEWDGTAVAIELRAYGQNVREGVANVILREEIERLTSERNSAIKKGKDDL